MEKMRLVFYRITKENRLAGENTIKGEGMAECVLNKNSLQNFKAINGLVRYLTGLFLMSCSSTEPFSALSSTTVVRQQQD